MYLNIFVKIILTSYACDQASPHIRKEILHLYSAFTKVFFFLKNNPMRQQRRHHFLLTKKLKSFDLSKVT